MAERVVTFTKPLVFEFEGNIFKNAICLGDIDNDDKSELIVGNDRGDLAIFKGENPKPIRYASNLGLISCVVVGDLLNLSRNVLLVIASDGACNVYDFHHQAPLSESDAKLEIKPLHSQKLPANIKMGLIGDINGDGFCEMVVALTDRIVRTYKWVDTGVTAGGVPEGKLIGQNKWELSDQIGGIALNRTDGSQTLLVSQPGGTCFTLKPPDDTEAAQFDENMSKMLNKMSIEYEALDSASCTNPKILTEICGDIELKNIDVNSFDRFKTASLGPCSGNSYFESEIRAADSGTGYVLATADGTVMLVRDRRILWKTVLHHPLISVSQLLVPRKERKQDVHKSATHSEDDFRTVDSTSDSDQDDVFQASDAPVYPFSYATGSKTSSAAKSNPPTPSKITIRIPNSKPKRINNRKKFGQPMESKIVACSSDGATFIMNVTDGKFCQFNFHDSVNCCTSGFYGYRKKDSASIAFAAYSNEIFLYPDLKTTLESRPTVMELLEQDASYRNALLTLGIDMGDREMVRKLNSFLLYGLKLPTIPFNPASTQ